MWRISWRNSNVRNWCAIVERRWDIVRGIGSFEHFGLFVRALAFALTVPLQVRLSWPRLDSLLERRFAGEGRTVSLMPTDWDRVRCIQSALVFGSPFVRTSCLTRGMTLYYFLRRAGIAVTLCFGIRRRGGELTVERGHCWLELEGAPILETADPLAGFLPICRLPLRGANREPCGPLTPAGWEGTV